MRCFDSKNGSKLPLAQAALVMIGDSEKRARLAMDYCRMGTGSTNGMTKQAGLASEIMKALDNESKNALQNCYRIYNALLEKWPGKEMAVIITSALIFAASMCAAARMRKFISDSMMPAMIGLIKPAPNGVSGAALVRRNKEIDTCLRLLSAVLLHAAMLVPWKASIFVLGAETLTTDIADVAVGMIVDDAMPQATATVTLHKHLIGTDEIDLRRILEKGAKALVMEMRKYRSYKLCGLCGSRAYKACGKCMVVRYCGRDCQAAHYPMHKLECHAAAHSSGHHHNDDV